MVRLIPYELNLDHHCELSVRWLNDERIRHLFTLSHPETGKYEVATLEDVRTNYAQGRLSGKYFRWMIESSEQLVGEVSLSLNPKHIITKEPNTGWISIVIGEPDNHRSGIGSAALESLETEARKLGCERIELGTFEFNDSAHKFYLKNGYKEILRIKDFVTWNNERWSDIRMLKNL